jgi:hypothetical protein
MGQLVNGDRQGVKRNRWYSLAAKIMEFGGFLLFVLLLRTGEEELHHYWLLATEMGGLKLSCAVFCFL